MRSAEAYYLAARVQVQAMLLAGLPVHDRETGQGRPVWPSDITLLLRVRTDLKLYEDAFQAHWLAGGGPRRPEVLDAISLPRCILPKMRLAAVLHSPYGWLSGQELLELTALRKIGETLWATLERTREYADFARWLCELRTGGLTAGASAVQAQANAQRGTDLIHAALPDGVRHTENLPGANEAGAISPVANALQMMTVHGSKGLDFLVVIYADALREGGGMEPVIRFDAGRGLALKLPDLEEPLPDWTRLAEFGQRVRVGGLRCNDPGGGLPVSERTGGWTLGPGEAD